MDIVNKMLKELFIQNDKIKKYYSSFWEEGVFTDCQTYLWMSLALMEKFFTSLGYSKEEISSFYEEHGTECCIGNASHNSCDTSCGVHNCAPIVEYDAQLFVAVQEECWTAGERLAHDFPEEYEAWLQEEEAKCSKSASYLEAFESIPVVELEDECSHQGDSSFDWDEYKHIRVKEFNGSLFVLTHHYGTEYWSDDQYESAWPGQTRDYDYYTYEIQNAHGRVTNYP